MILAAAMLVFACGGNSGKKGTAEQKEIVEQKAAKYATEIFEAELAGDYDKMDQLALELEKWAENLSEEEMAKAQAAFMTAVEKFEADHYGDEYDDWDEEDW